MKALAIPQLEDLVTGGCEEPTCTSPHDSIVLSARCHPGKGVDVRYFKGSGVMELVCHVCESLVDHIKVAQT